MSRLFSEYAYQVIDREKKRITYTDKPEGRGSEVLPIEFRKKIGPEFAGFKIRTK